MTRAEQNEIIINKITDKLRDLPNIQQIISAKFDEWFRKLVEQGSTQLETAALKQQASEQQADSAPGGMTEQGAA